MQILLQIAITLAAGLLLSRFTKKLGLPSVTAYLVAGMLIGPYAAGLQDDYITAVDHAAPMYGIEIQANEIDAFRSGFAPREVSERIQLAVLFALCAASLWFFWDRKVLHALPVWLALCGGWVALCALLFRGGHILHVFYVPLFVTAL